MVIQEIFRVVYSPLKAFEEIAKAPNVKGPLLILLITLPASISLEYIRSSKILLEVETGGGIYTPFNATDLFRSRLISTLTSSTLGFFLKWLIYGASFLLILKLFRTQEGPWHHIFILIGYTFIVATIFVIVNAILISTLPIIRLDFETWTQAFLEGDVEALSQVLQEYERNLAGLPAQIAQIGFYLIIVNEVWTTALGAIAVHFLREVSWNKAIVVSVIVSSLSLLLMGPLVY